MKRYFATILFLSIKTACAQSADPGTVAIGNSYTAAGDNSAAGYTSSNSTAGAVAIGAGNGFSGALNGPTVAIAGGVAIGPSAQATGSQADIAVGFGATSTVGFGIALGQLANSGASGAIGVGLNTNALGFQSVALGPYANTGAFANNSLALGTSSSVTTVGGAAIGNGASVTAANSVALGAGSTTNDGRANQVSIGSAGSTRLLTNVSAGVLATDGANVGQVNAALASANAYTDSSSATALKSANTYTNSVATTTLSSANTYTDNSSKVTLANANTFTTSAIATSNAATAVLVSNSSAATLNSANNYTNQAVAAGVQESEQYTDAAVNNLRTQFFGQLTGIRNFAAGGVAAAMSVPSAPSLNEGEHYVGMGLGTYYGQVSAGVTVAIRTMNLDVAASIAQPLGGSYAAFKTQVGYRW